MYFQNQISRVRTSQFRTLRHSPSLEKELKKMVQKLFQSDLRIRKISKYLQDLFVFAISLLKLFVLSRKSHYKIYLPHDNFWDCEWG